MQRKRILLISSTMGHRKHLAAIAQAISGSGTASAYLLNMSRMAVGATIAGVQEYHFSELEKGGGIHAKEDFDKKEASLAKWKQIARRAHIRLSSSMDVLGFPMFMILFAWEACRLAIVGVNKSRIWREAFRNALQRLSRLVQKKGGGDRSHLAEVLMSQIFWGLRTEGWKKYVFDHLMADIKPDLVILPELNWGYSHALVANYCKSNGIQLLVMPYTLAGRQEWWASFREDPQGEVKGPFRRLVARLFPEWVIDSGGHRVMLPLSWFISCELLGWSPAIPWVSNSGPDCVVAVDNKFTLEFYRREGVDTTNWEVVGSLAEDTMHRAYSMKAELRMALEKTHSLPADNKWALIALPPDQYLSPTGGTNIYRNYTQLVRQFVLETLSALGDGWTVIVNLHPRCDKGVAGAVEESGGKVIERPIEELLPLVELFLASSSATLRWAIACQVPAINYDVYHYGYDDYRSCAGIAEARSPQEYRKLLLEFKQDFSGVGAWKLRQRSDSQRYFIFDGESEERILSKVNSLMKTAS